MNPFKPVLFAELARWIDADADSPLARIPPNHHLGTSRSRWK
jgi:hypothetical protein